MVAVDQQNASPSGSVIAIATVLGIKLTDTSELVQLEIDDKNTTSVTSLVDSVKGPPQSGSIICIETSPNIDSIHIVVDTINCRGTGI